MNTSSATMAREWRGAASTAPAVVNPWSEESTVAKRTCSIEGCEREHEAKGLCAFHYRRATRCDLPLDAPFRGVRSTAERLWALVDLRGLDECWMWLGGVNPENYGRFNTGKKHNEQAHRVAYEIARGAIAPGLVLDHLCHTSDRSCAGGRTCPHRRCCNPWHLEPVTPEENARRGGQSRKTHCKRGHPFDEENTVYQQGCRQCRTCIAAKNERRNKARRKQEGA